MAEQGLITKNSMSAIANAVRSKNGTSTQYRPNELPAAIESIKTDVSSVILANMIATDNARDAGPRTATAAVTGAKIYVISTGAKSESYGVTVQLQGYIDGIWENIINFSADKIVNDDSNNGGGGTHYGYRSGTISKNYTSFKLTVDSLSVYPGWATCCLIK